MTEPISDEDLDASRDALTDWNLDTLSRTGVDDPDIVAQSLTDAGMEVVPAGTLARLDVAEADLRSEIEDANELVELFGMALAERDAALASSPEGACPSCDGTGKANREVEP